MRRCLSSLLRCVANLLNPPRHDDVHVSPEQVRKALVDIIRDPETRRLIFPALAGPAPIQGGTNYTAGNIPKSATTGSTLDLADTATPIFELGTNIGIGTTAPTLKLEVAGSIAANPAANIMTTLVGNAGAAGSFNYGLGNNLYFDGTNWIAPGDGANNGAAAILTSEDAGALKFYTLPSTGGSAQTIPNANLPNYERMRITNDGNVGIGTGNPTQKLDVATGSIALGYNLAATNQLVKTFGTAHAAGNVPSELDVVLVDGGQAGMLIKNVRDGSYNSQSLEFCTHHGG